MKRTIRGRYLELVRQFPPERAAERFAEIRAAYDALRDPRVSLEHRLFDVKDTQTFADIAAEIRIDLRARRVPVELLMSLGAS